MTSAPFLQSSGGRDNNDEGLLLGSEAGSLIYPDSNAVGLRRNSGSTLANINEQKKECISLGAATNLTNAIIGAGILTLPYAFARVGMVLGCSLMIIFAVQTVYVCNILRACCSYTRECTYSGLGRQFFGRRLEVGIDSLLGVYAFASCIGYQTILGDEMLVIFSLLQENYNFHMPFAWMESRSFLLAMLTGVFTFPLCLLRSVKSLQYAAFLAVSSALYIAFVVFIQMPAFSDVCQLAEVSMYTCVKGQCVVEPRSLKATYLNLTSCAQGCEGSNGPAVSEPIWANFGSGLWQSLPLFIYAFNCVVPFVPILTEMKRKRPTRIRTTLTFAVTVCLIAYCMCAFGGYLGFCDRACPNILDCYPASNGLVLPARIALLVNLIFIVPLFNFIVRGCLEKQLGLVSDAPGADMTESSNPTLSVFLTVVLVSSSTALACVFKNLGVILGLTGAVGGSILVWILPGLFLLKMLKTGGGKAALYGVPLTVVDTPGSETNLSFVDQDFSGDDAKEARLKFSAYMLISLGVVLLCLGTALTIIGS